MDFNDHDKVIKYRKTAQEVECDRRDTMREAIHFVTNKHGQWESDIWNRFQTYDRPRYTFDKTKPLLMKAWGEIADQEIQVNIKPAYGGADKDTAMTLAGLYRNIEYQSKAKDIYSTATRRFMTCGFDAIMVEQDWADNDSFAQELFIRAIPNAVDRVWFFGNWTMPTAEDAPAVTVDHMLDDEEFKEMFGDKRTCSSLDTDSQYNYYYYKRQGSIVSQLFWKEPIEKTLYEGPNGEVFDESDTETLESIAAVGIDIKTLKTRKRKSFKVMTRYYDAKGWLNEPEETVFDLLPVIPGLPNFEIVEDKPISMGMVEPLMDEQRVHNYAVSKYVGDTALAPKPKIWATKEHVQTYEPKLKTYNDNKDPIFIYNHVADAPPPFQMGPSGVDPSIVNLVEMSSRAIEETAGLYGPSLGEQMGQQSGIAIERLQHKGDVGSLEYHQALVRMAEQTAKVCVRAIPRVYDTPMTKRIIGEDGGYESVEINKETMTPEGPKKINDLTVGVYDVYCDIGPAYRSRREETADKLEKLGAIDPTIIMQNKDIFLSSIDSPGMDKAAERARVQLIKMGEIPDSQLTEEEREEIADAQAAAAANPPPPDPATVIAQAEAQKAQAEADAVTVRAQMESIKLQQQQQKLDFEQEKQKIELLATQQKDQIDSQVKVVDMLNTMADTLNKISQSLGAQAIVSPDAAKAYAETAKDISQTSETL